MSYSVDVIFPVEIALISSRVETFDNELTVEGLKFQNDLLEEVRNGESVKVVAQQAKRKQRGTSIKKLNQDTYRSMTWFYERRPHNQQSRENSRLRGKAHTKSPKSRMHP